MFSRYFIERPIFAAVVSIIIVLAGMAALLILPVSQYPEIVPPAVTVSASYPGASAETLSRTVAAPIEEQLSGIENLLYFNSTSSSDGSVTITVTFEVGTDIDKATFNVNNRVQLAVPRLPEDVRRNGIVVNKRSSNFLLIAALISPQNSHNELFLSNYATQSILDELKRIPGTADVSLFGARDYSMRIWLNPDRMAKLGITTAEINEAIAAQNTQYAVGKIGDEPIPKDQELVVTVTASGRLVQAEEFGNIVLRASGPNGVLRLKDVARIELGAQSYSQTTMINGKPSVGIVVFLQSGANALQVGKAVKNKLAELKKDRFPKDVDYIVPYDTTLFVSASIKEVINTVIEAAIIVMIVVFLFLQTWRATLIPMLAVPVSLIGTFAGLWVFGFSINTLTLFAMVLAIGIVVDDAIVVLENVERLMREKALTPIVASVEAMREVSKAVIGIVLVLCAVFIPVAFMGGIAGELYRQFAVTVAISVVISGVVALTLTPALCALLLKPHHNSATRLERMFDIFNNSLGRITNTYMMTVHFSLKRRIAALCVFFIILCGIYFLGKIVPGSFVPDEDQGYIFTSVVLPDGSTLARTERTTEQFRLMNSENSAIKNVYVVNGYDMMGGGTRSNSATIFILLKDWEERNQTAQQLVEQMSTLGLQLKDGIGFAFNPPGIEGLGQAGGFEVYVQSRSGSDVKKLAQVTQNFISALGSHPALMPTQTFFSPTVPQLRLEVDREKALALGVPVNDVFSALQTHMGSLYINDFNRSGRTYRVTAQADAQYRSEPGDLGQLYVRSLTSSEMIPLKTLISMEWTTGAEQIERFNNFISAKIMGSAKPGYSSGEAIEAVEQVARQVLPAGFSIEWTGQAFQEKRAGSSAIFAFGFALVMVYLILSAMYERWGVPMAVILTVPFALAGALLAVLIRYMPNDIYFQIGLVVLIGLSAKNAILIAEFAMQGMENGLSSAEAALEAAKLRFRPILMTSLAFILGVMPLVFATGAGAAARQSMGTGVFGGMLAATFVAPMFVPLFFTLLARKQRRNQSYISVLAAEETI